jgi:DNA-binding transcriptional MerR regulator
MAEYFMPISELSKKLNVPAHTLRYWEKEFPTLIAPTTGAGGRRYYRGEIVDNAFSLKKYLYADGYTIDGVKKLVFNGEFHSVPNSSTMNIEKETRPRVAAGEKISVPDNPVEAAISLLKEARAILNNN